MRQKPMRLSAGSPSEPQGGWVVTKDRLTVRPGHMLDKIVALRPQLDRAVPMPLNLPAIPL